MAGGLIPACIFQVKSSLLENQKIKLKPFSSIWRPSQVKSNICNFQIVQVKSSPNIWTFKSSQIKQSLVLSKFSSQIKPIKSNKGLTHPYLTHQTCNFEFAALFCDLRPPLFKNEKRVKSMVFKKIKGYLMKKYFHQIQESTAQIFV